MAENSYDYPMVLEISDEEDEAYEPKHPARRDLKSRSSSIEITVNAPSRGADTGLRCNVIYNPWPMDKEPPEYCNHEECHHECCRRDYYIGEEHENIFHCDGDPIRYAKQMFPARRGPSGSSWVNRPRTQKNINDYIVNWNTQASRTRQISNLVEERTEVTNRRRNVKGKGKEVEQSRKRQREISVEQDAYRSEDCDSQIWSPDSAKWEDPRVDMHSRFDFRSNT